MLLSDSSPMLSRREEEDFEQHRPMASPMLLFAGQASSGSVPMIAGIPTTGNLPWIRNLLSRAALSCVTAAKFAFAPWIIITLTSVAILVGTGMLLPHLLGPRVSTQVNVSANSHQQVIPMPMQSGQTDCFLAGNAHVHDVQIQFCTSRLGKVSGNPSSPQQQGILLSNRSSSLASTVLLPHVANGKLQAAVSSPVQRLPSLNTAVLSSTTHLPQTRSVFNESVSIVRQVVRSVVSTTMHLPQVGNILNKSVSTVHQIVQNTVATTTATQQPKVVQRSVSTPNQQPKTEQSTVSTTTAKQQPKVGDVLILSTSTIHP